MKEFLEKEPVSPLAAKVVGGVMLWIGVAFCALLLWTVYKLFSPNVRMGLVPVFLLGATAAIAWLCLSVGYRLFFNRPNRYRSILGPGSWRILGGFFGLATVVMVGAAFFTDAYMDFPPAALFVVLCGSGAFAYGCLRTARRIGARAPKA